METNKTVSVKVDAGTILGELQHSWRYIGYDECNYTHTPEGEDLIAKFGKLEDAPYFMRAHHMLCTGNGHGVYKWGSTNAYTEDEQGNPVYHWDVIDDIPRCLFTQQLQAFFRIGFYAYGSC